MGAATNLPIDDVAVFLHPTRGRIECELATPRGNL